MALPKPAWKKKLERRKNIRLKKELPEETKVLLYRIGLILAIPSAVLIVFLLRTSKDLILPLIFFVVMLIGVYLIDKSEKLKNKPKFKSKKDVLKKTFGLGLGTGFLYARILGHSFWRTIILMIAFELMWQIIFLGDYKKSKKRKKN